MEIKFETNNMVKIIIRTYGHGHAVFIFEPETPTESRISLSTLNYTGVSWLFVIYVLIFILFHSPVYAVLPETPTARNNVDNQNCPHPPTKIRRLLTPSNLCLCGWLRLNIPLDMAKTGERSTSLIIFIHGK